MTKRTAIPAARTGNVVQDRFNETVKQNMDALTGQQQNSTPLARLDPATATAAQCATLLNAIVDRLQGT